MNYLFFWPVCRTLHVGDKKTMRNAHEIQANEYDHQSSAINFSNFKV